MVAVLIVNYRVYEDLDRVLASVRRAVRPGDEVVVFDQASQADALASIAARYPDVRCIASADNVGFAAGINRAAAVTSAPFLLWLNPDTILDGPVLEALEAWLVAHPDTATVGPTVRNEDGSLQQSARRFPDLSTAFAGRSTWLTRHFPNNPLSRHNLLAQAGTSAMAVDWLAGSCVLTRRDVFERVGGLDEGFFLYWEDADYCRRTAALGLRTMYLPTVAVRHVGGRSAALDPAPAIRAFHASAYRLYAKHCGPAGRLILPVVRAALWARGEWLARAATRRLGGRGRVAPAGHA
jgi:GT2 family glycosyltransferase